MRPGREEGHFPAGLSGADGSDSHRRAAAAYDDLSLQHQIQAVSRIVLDKKTIP
jgi:hypothetical protein